MKLEKNHWLSNAYLVFVFAVLYAPIFYLIYYSFQEQIVFFYSNE